MQKPSQKNNEESVNKHPYLVFRCVEFIKIRPRTEKEIHIYLYRKKAPQQTIEEVISILKDKNLIDDVSFVPWLVDQRTYFKKKGIRAIQAELTQKGVSRDIINDFFSTYKSDEAPLAVEALSKIHKKLEVEMPKKRFEKAISHLLRRGFSYAVAKKAFEQLYEVE